jgi:5-methylcytosine-specific restriction endonuclease McrA
VCKCRICGAEWMNIGGRGNKGARSAYCSDGCFQSRHRYESRGSYRRSCATCGTDFETTQPSKRYCNERCRKGQLSGRYDVRDTTECRWCGRGFRRAAAQLRKLYCEAECQKAYRAWDARGPLVSWLPEPPPPPSEPVRGACEWCLRLFVVKRSTQLYCSTKCRQAAYSEPVSVHFIECFGCGDLFTSRRSEAKYCSRGCRKARDRWPISPKKRAKVLERDGGICHLCSEPVDESDFTLVVGSDGRETVVVGERYPSLDHLVPKSLGGDHSMSNLKTAHHGCNSRRGVSELEAA